MFYWLEFSQMVTPKCSGGWEGLAFILSGKLPTKNQSFHSKAFTDSHELTG